MQLQHALKEWSVAVEALAQGKTSILLRKGGIRETGGKFSVPHQQVLLYPTFEHQRPELLKPDYQDQVQPVASGWHPETVTLNAWATIEQVEQVQDTERVQALLPLHIWNEQFITERLRWKPKIPLYVLLLRVYALPQSTAIPWNPTYGGCRSWIEVPVADVSHAQPVLTDAAYRQQQQALTEVLA
ncbi:MAG: DUF1802 family protein [Cyanobacteria bacterium J06632_22]